MPDTINSRDRLLGGWDQNIMRRDFIGSTLIGAGAALITQTAPVHAQGLTDAWTGPSGVGDYAGSNGNTAQVVNAAHGIRDRKYQARLGNAEPRDEIYDLVIVGSGFSGMTAAYEFSRNRDHQDACLVLDNHPVFGGEAKQNEFDVDGYHLYGPQGSNDNKVPERPTARASLHRQVSYKYWSELNLPRGFQFAEPHDLPAGLKVARDNYYPMFWDEGTASVGFFFGNDGGRKPTWLKNIWQNKLIGTPFEERVRDDLIRWRYGTQSYGPARDEERWLDSMSYSTFIQGVMGLSPAVCDYVDPILGAGDCGLTSDVFSAYAAREAGYPGSSKPEAAPSSEGILSFPGGNAALLRHFVKAVNPAAILGKTEFNDIATQPIDFKALDKPGLKVAIRQNSTVVAVQHEGAPESAEYVGITYLRNGRLNRVRARTVILCIGAWVTKHILLDLPSSHRTALEQFHHGPVLTVNIALRNWRFMEKLGISAARWFEGLGFFANFREPMVVGRHPSPLDPNKPVVLTSYAPFGKRGLPVAEQAAQARMSLFATSYATFEGQIRRQMELQFADYGFDAKRDIAGIVLNRWGHAFICPQPGFFFARDGGPSASDILRGGFGRIRFGHSELNGFQDWAYAAIEGSRACHQAMAIL